MESLEKEKIKEIEERLDEINKRHGRIGERNAYANQYLDSFYFLLIGTGLGILGGFWSNFFHQYFSRFPIPYLITLMILSIFVFKSVLGFALKTLKPLGEKNTNEFSEIKKEFDLIKEELGL